MWAVLLSMMSHFAVRYISYYSTTVEIELRK